MVMLANSGATDFMMGRSRVCRRLTFDSDTDQRSMKSGISDESKHNLSISLRRSFHESFTTIMKQKKERWNFDFENEVPLDGRYQWVFVGNDSCNRNDAFNCTATLNDSISSSSSSPFSDSSLSTSTDSTSSNSFNNENIDYPHFGKIRNKRFRQTILKVILKMHYCIWLPTGELL
ncbi:hypothetical protein HELRODRAFT_159110 [Helobdella robusta]|uniref:Cyclin-dependent kinase inhibitor domain-containing protein n=1 Tax=Helobdella robusta TaxID=6412 RepID=T1ENL9_HELRO|nr:hypothetical protein HELRODRAFT_159110 [Helobdella robusta]ESO12551.1 hypothetical protein HELRODRAFT_159110 [Helobdella robusta]